MRCSKPISGMKDDSVSIHKDAKNGENAPKQRNIKHIKAENI